MASVSMVKRKSGYAFKLQVKFINWQTGKPDSKAKYWTPPNQGSSKRQMEQNEHEARRLGDAYEAEIKALYNNRNNTGLTPDSTFEECAKVWLEKIKLESCAFSHIEASKDCIAKCLEHIGQIQLRKLSQDIIQNFFDWIDRREKITITVRSKPPVVREVMKQRNESYATLTQNHGLNDNTICAVLNGKTNVSYEYAKRFAEVLKADVNELFDIQEKRERYAYNTNHKIKATVRAILSLAKKRRLVTDNYAKAEFIDFPKRLKKKKVKCMDENQVRQVYQAIMEYEDIRYATVLLTLILTGCRKGELVGLKWENIDLEKHRITIERSVTRVKNHKKPIVKDPKTENSTRTIGIPTILSEQLAKYKEWYFDRKESLGDRWDNNDWVFVNEDSGQRISPDMILTWINKITEKAGLGHWTVHSMRHTNITMKLTRGVSLLEVAGQAGHSRTSTTTDIYGHYINTNDTAPQLLDKIILMPIVAPIRR